MKMEELCSTCLSKHRTLVPLLSIEVLSSQTISFAGSPVLVCWECGSRLQKMQEFKAQATKAQALLKLYVENQKPLKALKSLSRLSQSRTKTDYDENFVYCMKQEAVECDNDLEIEVKFDTQELIPKAEKIDADTQEPYQSKEPDKESQYVTVEPVTGSNEGDGYDSDEWPLSEVKDKKVDHQNESDIKTEPKKHKIEQKGKKVSKKKEKDNFTTKIMAFKEMHRKHTEGELEKCKICCGSYRNIAVHARTSCGPESAFCVECGVSFKTKKSYKRHLVSHPNHRHQSDASALRWYVCDECGSRFTNKSSLMGHIASIHTKRYPYNCHICQKGYKRAADLKNHILERHEGGERPRKYRCSHCGKAFKDKSVLVSHIRTHTGERPFKCPHCPWSFTQKWHVRTHMRAKHPGENTGNTGKSARGVGNTDDGGKAEMSGKGKNEP